MTFFTRYIIFALAIFSYTPGLYSQATQDVQHKVDTLSLQLNELRAINDTLTVRLSQAESNILALGAEKEILSQRILYLSMDSLANSTTISVLQSLVQNLIKDSILLVRLNEKLNNQYNELLLKYNSSINNLALVVEEKKHLESVWLSAIDQFASKSKKDSLLLLQMWNNQRVAGHVIDSQKKMMEEILESSSKRLAWYEYAFLFIPIIFSIWVLFRKKQVSTE